MTPGFESTALRPPAAGLKAYPLQQAIAAYEQVLQGGAGRVVLTMR